MDEPIRKSQLTRAAGYVVSKRNPLTGHYNVVYDAVEQGLDDDGGRWAVVCNAHSTIINAATKADAKICMEHSANFCEECQKLLAAQPAANTLAPKSADPEKALAARIWAEIQARRNA